MLLGYVFEVNAVSLITGLGIGGIALAWMLYKTANNKPQQVATALGGLYKAAYKKFYIDELYLFITKKIVFNLIGRPAAWIDRNIFDGLMNGIAATTANRSRSANFWFWSQIITMKAFFLYASCTVLPVVAADHLPPLLPWQ